MFLYILLMVLYLIVCILLVPLILIQKAKAAWESAPLGGSNQMLFGGSGGQDIFQKATWVLGSLFMIGSLVLALMKSQQLNHLAYAKTSPTPTQTSQPLSPK